MKPENAIEVRDVRKNLKVYYDKGHMLRERVPKLCTPTFRLAPCVYVFPPSVLTRKVSG